MKEKKEEENEGPGTNWKVRYKKKERKTKKKMRGRESIWGVNERKGEYVDGGEKKKEKKKGTGTKGERGKKIEKRRYFGSCEKKYIY